MVPSAELAAAKGVDICLSGGGGAGEGVCERSIDTMHTIGLVVAPVLALQEVAQEGVLWVVCPIEAAD